MSAKKKTATKSKSKAKAGKGHQAYLANYDRRKIDKATMRMRLTNNRAQGTDAAKRAAEAVKFIKSNPKATIKEVIANTSYRLEDLRWDLNAENATLLK